MDHLSPADRSKNMAAIKAHSTAPELAVRHLAHILGYRFRLRRRDLPGKPDLVFPSRRAVIFVHGCFWHQHSSVRCKARLPKSNLEYWEPKLSRNLQRDKKNQRALRRLGWRVLIVWECHVGDQAALSRRLVRFLEDGR